jgi:hypothetical protein
MVGFVLLCLFLQALLIPAERISERSHFHLSPRAVSNVSALSSGRGDAADHVNPATPAWLAPKAGQSVARAVFEHRLPARAEAAAHQHTVLQDHEHGERADAVYVSTDDSAAKASHGPSIKRLLLDQDGLWAGLLPRLVITCARVAHAKSTLLLRTRTELPLDRPPH